MATVFISYASEQDEIAGRIELSLRGDGHAVFRDRSSLPAGEAFDSRIREQIEESDVLVFLISQASVTPGRYTLTELKLAEQRWPHPTGRVLPVLVEPVPKERIPPYLRAVTILTPRGNLVAEVTADVARMTGPWWRRMLAPRRLVPAVVALVVLAAVAWMVLPPYLERRAQVARAVDLVKQSEEKIASRDYQGASKLLEEAREVAPTSSEVQQAQERLAMDQLRGAGIEFFRGNRSAFTALVDRTLPVLSRSASVAQGERLADVLAHMGWAEYLRQLGGVGGTEPAEHYRRALEIDPRNVYAHAMWGFEVLRQRRSAALTEARPHFAAAVASGRERPYVRRLQISALLQTYTNVWIENAEREGEALRVANEMRVNNEPRPAGWRPGSLKKKLWSIYHFDVVTADQLAPLLAALPAAEHLAMFRWLFPEDDLPENDGAPAPFFYLFVLAQLQEHSGDRAGALGSYRRLLAEAATRNYNATRALKIVDDANAAIKRLS